jgi:hypothetical protein
MITAPTVEPLTRSRRLLAKIALGMPHMMSAQARLWADSACRDRYVEWLRVMHSTIRATEPLMLAATQRCLALRPDPVAEALAEYLSRHIGEEYGHDGWVRADYARCGEDPADLDRLLPDATIAALVGAQYYWLHHVHPVALVGHIVVLEGFPPSTGLAAKLAEDTRLPLEAFSALHRHAVLDVKHRADVLRVVDGLPMTGWHEELVGASALHTILGVCEVVDATMRRVPLRADPSAP